MKRLKCVGAVFALLAMPTSAWADGYILLQDVPDSLRFPGREGANLILKASVEDAEVESVWLGVADPGLGRVALTRVGPTDYQINLYSNDVFDLLKQAPARGEFRIFAQSKGGGVLESIPVSFMVDAPPARLKLNERTPFIIYQKRSAFVPGSGDRLRVYAGDITRGQITLSILSRDKNVPLVPTTRLTENQHIVLPLEEATYVIEVEKLHNYWMDNDYADLSITSESDWHHGKIEYLLGVIAKSECIFIRNGEEYDGAAAANHFRRKMEAVETPITKVDEFIENIASNSSTTGAPYRMRTLDGTESEIGPWLRSQLEARAESDLNRDTSGKNPEQDAQSQS
jgi:hypothetical protein